MINPPVPVFPLPSLLANPLIAFVKKRFLVLLLSSTVLLKDKGPCQFLDYGKYHNIMTGTRNLTIKFKPPVLGVGGGDKTMKADR